MAQAIRNCNDGTQSPPRLRLDMNGGGLSSPPAFSTAPRGSEEEILAAIKAAGFEGFQGGNPQLCRKVGLRYTTGGRINARGEAEPFAKKCRDDGADCAAVHVAWGIEDDAEVDALVHEIINSSIKHDVPIYIETHRATITQDIWRTVQLTKRFPGIRFNGDFSHWYTGLEMPYGNIDAKFDYMQPVFDRVAFIHGRIGNPGSMQVDIGDGTNQPYVEHFKEMWTRSFLGFLKSAKPGDYLCFTPELLGPPYYARLFKNSAGELVQESDRWAQSLLYTKIAVACFEEARKRLK